MPATRPRPPARTTAQQLALQHIRGLIADGTLKPEQRIRQEQLAAELGTSVIPVREALKTLEAEGQVTYFPHRGFQVARLSAAELDETYEIRRLLEDAIVRLAAPRLDAARFAELERLMDQMEGAGDGQDVTAMIEANRRFHFTIFEAAERPRMVDLVRQLWQATDAYRTLYYSDATARRRVNEEHRRIVAMLREGQVTDVVRLLDEHRQHAVEGLADRLAASGP